VEISMSTRSIARSRVAVVLAVGAAMLLAACGGGTAPTPEGSASGSPGAAASGSPAASTGSTGSPAAAGSTVRLLAHDSFVVSQALIDDFEKQTGMTLEVVTGGDAGAMVAGAILAAGSPTADVMFGVDNTLVSRTLAADVFEPYRPAALDTVAPALRTDTANGVVTPIDYGDVCVNIDDAALAERRIAAPTTLDDLAKPAYRDLLVVEDPATSSPGLAFLLATIARYGDGWQDYWQRLSDNGVKVASSWTDAYEGDFSGGGGAGDRPLVVSYATSPPAEIVYASDPKPTKPSTSVMTDGCYRQVEYAGVLAGAANPKGAQAVVDWLLSEPVQADVPLSMFVFPAREGTPLPDVFTRFAAVVPAPLQLPAQQVADSLPQWLADWGTVMGR
jgi:thiamine transport system substrate-binding protein